MEDGPKSQIKEGSELSQEADGAGDLQDAFGLSSRSMLSQEAVSRG